MHKKATVITSVLFFLFLFSAINIHPQEKTEAFKFVGVEVCAPCHKTEKQGKQLDIWKESKHSNAFITLQTSEANEVAKAAGFNTPAAETEACLKCHTSGYNWDKSLLEAKFKMSDGVQCETCHGPGSHYKPIKIMKDRALSIENGLIVYENIEDLCVSCHNSESPTFKGFEFSTMWDQIKHPVPGDK
jgi:hypothetical protein